MKNKHSRLVDKNSAYISGIHKQINDSKIKPYYDKAKNKSTRAMMYEYAQNEFPFLGRFLYIESTDCVICFT